MEPHRAWPRAGPGEGVLRENIERILNLHADFVNPKHHVRDGGGDDHELGERGAPRGDQASRQGRQHDQPDEEPAERVADGIAGSKPPEEQAAVEVTMDAPGWPFDSSL
jgi:hypothetical protein